ncbi:hypothetical protein PF008_g294 [Phytophthora fragariae]|uniref:Uncharacterized protein n=1 Tax=Phytophthora fragariae TaxID=53985 RepID=A0A6G0SP19_9STRA|nr:hypothetical protein PF008_g294 [Phytophthora fragariae]
MIPNQLTRIGSDRIVGNRGSLPRAPTRSFRTQIAIRPAKRAHNKTEAGLAAWTFHVDASSLHQRGVQHSVWRTAFLPHSRYRCSAARMASPSAEMAAPAATSKWTVTEELLRKRKNPATPPTSDDYKDWSLEQLRLECTARRLNVKKNTCKSDRMQLLTAYDS